MHRGEIFCAGRRVDTKKSPRVLGARSCFPKSGECIGSLAAYFTYFQASALLCHGEIPVKHGRLPHGELVL